MLIIAVLCGAGNASQQKLDDLQHQRSRCRDGAVHNKRCSTCCTNGTLAVNVWRAFLQVKASSGQADRQAEGPTEGGQAVEGVFKVQVQNC